MGSVGGGSPGEAKSFQPIHACCASCIPRKTSYTDFNAFFDRIATLVKRQGLVLAPLNIVILSDGLPDVTGRHGADGDPYAAIDLAPLEYLSRSVSVRLLYASPTVAVDGSGAFPADVWTVDGPVMVGWREQLQSVGGLEQQDALWKWVNDNVDFRVRSRRL